jgi:hypothetical protein
MTERIQSEEYHPFADSRVRALLGLSGGITILIVAFLFIEEPMVRWLLVGVAAVDVIVTPYMLKWVAEQAGHDE